MVFQNSSLNVLLPLALSPTLPSVDLCPYLYIQLPFPAPFARIMPHSELPAPYHPCISSLTPVAMR